MSDNRPLYVSPEDQKVLRPLFERDGGADRDQWELFVLGFMAGQTHTMQLMRQALRERGCEPNEPARRTG